MDAIGDLFMAKYRADCLEYIKLWNKDSQLRLNDQNFLGLFVGGIYKLDKPNEDYQQSSAPSVKPRLSGVFRKGGCQIFKMHFGSLTSISDPVPTTPL